MKTLSEQLTELSERAAKIEARAAAAKEETQAKLNARVEAAKAEAETQRQAFMASAHEKGEQAKKPWLELKKNMEDKFAEAKSDIADFKHSQDLARAQKRADRLEEHAAHAIAFALMAMDEAENAVLEAVDARLHAKSMA